MKRVKRVNTLSTQPAWRALTLTPPDTVGPECPRLGRSDNHERASVETPKPARRTGACCARERARSGGSVKQIMRYTRVQGAVTPMMARSVWRAASSAAIVRGGAPIAAEDAALQRFATQPPSGEPRGWLDMCHLEGVPSPHSP